MLRNFIEEWGLALLNISGCLNIWVQSVPVTNVYPPPNTFRDFWGEECPVFFLFYRLGEICVNIMLQRTIGFVCKTYGKFVLWCGNSLHQKLQTVHMGGYYLLCRIVERNVRSSLGCIWLGDTRQFFLEHIFRFIVWSFQATPETDAGASCCGSRCRRCNQIWKLDTVVQFSSAVVLVNAQRACPYFAAEQVLNIFFEMFNFVKHVSEKESRVQDKNVDKNFVFRSLYTLDHKTIPDTLYSSMARLKVSEI